MTGRLLHINFSENVSQSPTPAVGEDQAAGATALLARAVRLAGASRSANAGPDYDNKLLAEVSNSHEIT